MSATWADPVPQPWSSGSWAFELRGDELADIRFDGSLVLRSIRAVARDRDWNTVPVTVTGVDGSLELTLRMTGFGADIDAALRVEVDGDRLRVAFTGRLLQDFERNRLGLIVLHPPMVAGAELTVISPDGAALETAFPERIAPHQPALDIAGLRWRHDGVAAELDFAGEVFEMEDQRNWTDASFKTYSTPLDLPFPVALHSGDTVEQSLALRCERVAPRSEPSAPAPLAVRPAGRPFPSIALGASTEPGTGPDGWMPPADAILVELETYAPTWPAALERAAQHGLPLDVRIVAAAPRELDPVLDALTGHRLVRLGVFSPRTQVTEPELWEALLAGAAARGIQAQPLGGARSHFTELNRSHGRLPAHLPALAFSVTPQMHATETAQLIESIGMQRLVAEDASRIAGGRPVHVGPVTLRSRYNTVATTPSPVAPDISAGYGAALLPTATDERQRSPELAAWLIASAAALAVDGVASITYFETWGPRGVVAASGEPYPVATAAEWLRELAGCPALELGPLPPDVWAVGADTPEGALLLIANLRPEPMRLALAAPFEVPALSAVRVVGWPPGDMVVA